LTTEYWNPRTRDRIEAAPRAGLRPQSRCRECNSRQAARRVVAQKVAADLESRGVTVTIRSASRRLLVDELPAGWLSRSVGKAQSRAEALAGEGITLVERRTMLPLLPGNPTKALRTAYRLLIPVDPVTKKRKKGEPEDDAPRRVGRVGAIDDDKLYFLHKLEELAASPGVPKKLRKHVEHVKGLAYLHAGGQEASDAVQALFPTYRRHHGKYANARVKAGLLTREDAELRLNAGILIGLLKWSPLHTSGALPTTRVAWYALRELQLRTRADRAIGVYEIEKGSGNWTKAATSIDGLGGKHADDEGGGSFVPQMTGITQDTLVTGNKLRNGKPVATADDREAMRADLTIAMRGLDATDQQIILWVSQRKKIPQIAEDLGITTKEAKKRLAGVRKILKVQLADYEGM
jgi:hypothetical protein